ncbi:hypothetical protein EW146_g5156 [Bondarzewia mesenterica]|uniref:Uncharacterized protein n=1 Tax=Bondarzewia mesenterica TaxID=1095465 RepID=A0A4S4LU53_9AGAM|nr:hypothetical protein EW146_g5156 [Bondarzewia mesenterica]
MPTFYDSIPANLSEWIQAQHVFWVATAPLSAEGHINISPKGLRGTFHVVDANHVWYEDITGSGIETISHVRENGRIVIQFNAFDSPPRIVRLWGKGTVYEFGTPEFEAYLPPDKRHPGARSVIFVDVHKISSSCGFGVPYYSFVGARDTLTKWNTGLERREQEHALSSPVNDDATPSHAEKGLVAYWLETNMKSIDGLPGMRSAHLSGKVPESRLVKDGKVIKEENETIVRAKGGVHRAVEVRKETDWVKLVIAFMLGLMVASIYGRYQSGVMDLLEAFVPSI